MESYSGCADLRDAVAIARPRLHAFGHNHRGWGLTTVCWKDEPGDGQRKNNEGEKERMYNELPEDRHPSEESRKNLRTVDDINPYKLSLDEAGKKVVEARVEQLKRVQCHHSSHCTGDKDHVVKGKQTLFANAAIATLQEQQHKQWPFLVDIELARDNSGQPPGPVASSSAPSSSHPSPTTKWSADRGRLARGDVAEVQEQPIASSEPAASSRYVPPHRRRSDTGKQSVAWHLGSSSTGDMNRAWERGPSGVCSERAPITASVSNVPSASNLPWASNLPLMSNLPPESALPSRSPLPELSPLPKLSPLPPPSPIPCSSSSVHGRHDISSQQGPPRSARQTSHEPGRPPRQRSSDSSGESGGWTVVPEGRRRGRDKRGRDTGKKKCGDG